MEKKQTPFYYHITGFESGIMDTGSRSANYHYFLYIYDEDLNTIESPLCDRFYGRWPKCQTVINKWNKAMSKAGLISKPI